MPSAKTYQAIGFVTYHAGKRELRRRQPELRRKAIVGAATAAGIAAIGLAAAGAAAQQRRARHGMH